jgi:hypothetical protein
VAAPADVHSYFSSLVLEQSSPLLQLFLWSELVQQTSRIEAKTVSTLTLFCQPEGALAAPASIC